jgi:cytosine/uracil/thiamine/allantoin permease
MDNWTPLIGPLVGTGITGLIITILIAIVWFILSAFITALWIRLILLFMHGTLEREYARMRGNQPGQTAMGGRPDPYTGM